VGRLHEFRARQVLAGRMAGAHQADVGIAEQELALDRRA
jgi:hypothetical protein